MKRFAQALLIGALLGILGMPSGLAAQAAPAYTLIDLGTLGGPDSYISGPGVKILNNAGTIGAIGYTSVTDTDLQNLNPTLANGTLAVPDPNLQHAFVWHNGVMTDVRALPGANTASFNWINAWGDGVGQSENGSIDPLTGLTAVNAVLWAGGHISNLGTLPGGYESLPTAISDSGLVVGFSTNAVADTTCGFIGCWGAQSRAVLWARGAIQDLGTLGGPDSVANYVNSRDQIAGASYTDAASNPVTMQPTQDPFLWENGHMRDLGTLGGSFGFPNGMNNRGEVIGQSNLAGDNTNHPFLWDGSRLEDLGTLGGANGTANWINDAGQVVGIADLSVGGIHHGFLWQNGTMTDLTPTPGAQCSNAYAINASGQAVGNATDCHGHVITTVLWDHGIPYALQSLVGPTDLHMTEAWNINDRGEIAGIASLPNGHEHAVLLIPAHLTTAAQALLSPTNGFTTSGSFMVWFDSATPGQGRILFGSGPGCSALVETATQDAGVGTTSHVVIVTGNDLPGTVGDNGIIPGATYWYEAVTVTKSGVETDNNGGKCYSVTVPLR